jgi:transglutaminase-like putative cysteine protease
MLGAPLRYRVTLEPTHQRWLFALDTVARAPERDAYMSFDRQLSTTTGAIMSTMSYDAVSYLRTRTVGPLSILGRRHETTLPAERNPRARKLALELRARSASDTEFARAALAWFRDNGLEYTLEPGVTSLDSVDTTLFDSKRGFCGHFASSYAMLMRAAGVPARVVTGYLGGEWNPVGGYLIVRQSDRHAWTEVWLEGSGWTRIDPTAVVAPDRLQRGIYDLLSDSLPRPARSCTTMRSCSASNRPGTAPISGGRNAYRVQFARAARVSAQARHRFTGLRHLGWAFGAGLALWILWVSVTLRRAVARAKPDRIGRAWLRATRKLARAAPARSPAEGPMDFASALECNVQTSRRAWPRLPHSTRGCVSARPRPKRTSPRWSARSGILTCDAHTQQQRATDCEQQHE